MKDVTSLRISKKLNIDLMIVSRLLGESKEALSERLLRKGLEKYLIDIERYRFK